MQQPFETNTSILKPYQSRNESLPTLSARKSLTVIRDSSLMRASISEKRLSMKSKRTMSLSRNSSINNSFALNSSMNRLYERINASMVGKLNDSALNTEAQQTKRIERDTDTHQKKVVALASLANAGAIEHFLGTLTDSFMATSQKLREDLPFNTNEPSEEGIGLFMNKQTEIYGVIKQVMEECIVGKMMARHGLQELGTVLISAVDTVINKFFQALNACKPQLRVKSILHEQKEQQALLVTKNEKTLFESIKLVNYLNNPLFELDDHMKEKYIHNLVKNKQFLRDNKTSFRIDVINYFEEDLKKIARIYTDTRGQNDILVKENQRLKTVIEEMEQRYADDKKLIVVKNKTLYQEKIEQEDRIEKAKKAKREREKEREKAEGAQEEGNNVLLTQVPQETGSSQQEFESIKSKDRKESDDEGFLLKGEATKGGARFEKAMTMVAENQAMIMKDVGLKTRKSDSQTFVIAYLQRELKYIDVELQKARNELDKMKIDKIQYMKRNGDLEDILRERQQNFKDAGIQCVFANEKEAAGEVDSLLEKILDGKDPMKMTAITQDQEWLLNTINQIYQDKFEADLMDDFEGRPRKNLKEFCKEWFLCKFGFQTAAETFLRDFLKTLKSSVQLHPRYKTFGMLIGLPEAYNLQLPDNMGNLGKEEKDVAREYLKRQFIMSQYGNSIFNKAVLVAKASSCSSGYDAFLPDCGNEEDTLEIKGLMAVLRDFLAQINLPPEEVKQILGQFDEMVEGDQYFKIIEKQLEKERNKLVISDEIAKGDLSVRMDYYLQFVVEAVAVSFVKELERIYTQLKLTNETANPANIPVDLFKDTFASLNLPRSSRWLDYTYEILMQKDIKYSPPIFQLLANLCPCFIYQGPPEDKYKLPDDGYPVFQRFVARQGDENALQVRLRKVMDLEGGLNLLTVTLAQVKGTISRYQKRAGNLEILYDLMEKDMASIKTIIENLKFTHRPGEKEKVKVSLEQNWRRLRTIVRVRHTVPREQAVAIPI